MTSTVNECKYRNNGQIMDFTAKKNIKFWNPTLLLWQKTIKLSNPTLLLICKFFPNQISHQKTDILAINPLDARRRYTDFAQTSLRRQTVVYRPNGSLSHAPEDGIPAAWCIVDPRRKTVYNLCFLMHTGPSIPES